ncbi:hypothetical protein BGZ95_010630 [Linnemannia exigua]|uniref:Uncharacterized protein n=1 Tax=Linnemannia exigua TaxID=604196 RepID=A0AAD4H4V1_9FUNG|nr:hypothetical protein BGZ95_010630 [Linnemannia exigua]
MANGSIQYHALKTRQEGASSPPSRSRSPSPISTSRLPSRNKSRISIAKAILLVSVSFMVLALVHVSYSATYENGAGSSPTTGNETPIEIEHHQQQQQQQKQPPVVQAPVEPVAPPGTPQQEPPAEPAQPPAEIGSIISDTDLTTTYRYENGTEIRLFKPNFYKNGPAAKKELGSFLQTLATRSWVVHRPEHKTQEDAPGEEEHENDDQEDDNQDQNAVPGRYFAYLPMGGGNNQFTSLQKAALLAKDLKRTLVLPPISPNSHIKTWAGPRYSQFYDLESFTQKSGIPVLEWHDIKMTPEEVPGGFGRQWEEFSEDLPCTPNGGIGVSPTSLYDKFRQQFLLKYVRTVVPEDKTEGKSTEYNYARDVLLRDKVVAAPAPGTTPTSPTPANGVIAVDPNMWKCLTCPYFLGGANVSPRTWAEVGVHLRFNEKTEAMVDDILDVLLGPAIEGEPTTTAGPVVPSSSTGTKGAFRPHPQFIIIHLRRGDIVNKCPAGMAEKDCIVQIEAIADKIDEIEKARRTVALESLKKTMKDDDPASDGRNYVHKLLPVLVTTNEQRREELDKIDRLGWILLDHGNVEKDEKGQVKPSMTKKLGTESKFGPWYPSMLDAVLLTRGDYMIGMQNSRMSILATQRGAAWHGHKTMLM